MQTIQTLVIVLGCLHLWFSLPISLKGRIGFTFNRWTDFKPLNCKFCLSFWVSIVLIICFQDLIYISLPFIYSKL